MPREKSPTNYKKKKPIKMGFQFLRSVYHHRNELK